VDVEDGVATGDGVGGERQLNAVKAVHTSLVVAPLGAPDGPGR
jgi:hypothetical protein